MRVVQYRILNTLLNKVDVPDYIYAFEKNRSIPGMASIHVGKAVVVSVDLKDFFTSIKGYHVDQLFKHLGVGDAAARTLSELCTYKSFVPQGALTSPKISNLITAFTFGPIIKAYCDERGYTLSIYADDITISSNTRIDGLEGRQSITELLSFLTQTVTGFGFKVNREKTKVMSKFRRQYVCGVVVNEKVNLQKTERNRLRAIVHNCGNNGLDLEALKMGITALEFQSKILGKINWFEQLNPTAGFLLKAKFKEICMEYSKSTVAVNEDVTPGTSVNEHPKNVSVAATTVPWME